MGNCDRTVFTLSFRRVYSEFAPRLHGASVVATLQLHCGHYGMKR